MPWQIEWIAPDRLYELKLFGNVVMEDITAVSAQAVTILTDSQVEKIHVLVNFEGLQTFPTELIAITKALNITQLRRFYYKQGWVVFVSVENVVVRFLSASVAQLLRLPFRHVATRDEGVDFLKNILENE